MGSRERSEPKGEHHRVLRWMNRPDAAMADGSMFSAMPQPGDSQIDKPAMGFSTPSHDLPQPFSPRADTDEPVIGFNFPPTLNTGDNGKPTDVSQKSEREKGQWESKQVVEHTPTTYEFREIKEDDLDTMIQNEWFKGRERVAHLYGDTINDNTLPKDWNNDEQVVLFREVLRKFYFPGGPFVQPAYNDEGNPIRNSPVVRKTKVMEKDGALVGATSWLEGEKHRGDPWAGDKEWKIKQSHTQMHVIAPEFEGEGLGIGLLIERTEQIFAAGYDRIITWVNLVPGYERNQTFFYEVGYQEDRGKSGLGFINKTVPGEGKIRMVRYVLTKEDWEDGAVREEGIRIGRDATIERWEVRKQGIGTRKKKN